VNACNTVHKAKIMISPTEAGRQARSVTSTGGTGAYGRKLNTVAGTRKASME